MIFEYGHDQLTHILFNFLVKSKLIDSIEELELELSTNFDDDLLFKLISEYKNNDSWNTSFMISYFINNPVKSWYNSITSWVNLIKLNPNLNLKRKNIDAFAHKIIYEYEVSKFYESGSDEDKRRLFGEFWKEFKQLFPTNNLLYHSLLYKFIKPTYLISYFEAELIKLNGEHLTHNIKHIDSRITKDGHLMIWRIVELNLQFTVISTDEGYNVSQTKEFEEKLNLLGFTTLNIKIKEEIIEKLCQEYLEFVVFPLWIEILKKENCNMIEKN